ncbi:MAG: hypothetical protein ACP5NF_08670 [Thermoanaerobaculum sp.]
MRRKRRGLFVETPAKISPDEGLRELMRLIALGKALGWGPERAEEIQRLRQLGRRASRCMMSPSSWKLSEG